MGNDECFCIGRAYDEICDDHLPLLHADCRAKLAEARALIERVEDASDPATRFAVIHEISTWLAANPEAKR